MQDMWHILEIAATNDVAIIKKAYARKLKIHHPEDDPQGYQNLREAYDRAIQEAKYSMEDNYIGNIEENIEYDSDNISLNHIFPSSPIIEEGSIFGEHKESNEIFMQGFKDLYSDFFSRIDIQKWYDLFSCEVIWNIYNRESIGDRILEFLVDHRNLPRDIWVFLDINFDWSHREYDHEDIYYKGTIDYIKQKVQETEGMGYYFDQNNRLIDYDAYLVYREAAYIAAEEKDLFRAFWNLDKAKEIYPSDPDLLLIEGKCQFNKGNANDALNLFNDLLAKIPNHIEGLLCRSDIYKGKKEYDLAIDDLRKIEAYSMNHKEMLFKTALCFKELKNFQLSKEYAKRALDTDPTHLKTIDLINEINNCMIRNLRLKIIQNPIDESQKKRYRILRKEIKQSKEGIIKKLKKKVTLKGLLLIALLLLLLFATVSLGFGQLSMVIIILFRHVFFRSSSEN